MVLAVLGLLFIFAIGFYLHFYFGFLFGGECLFSFF